MRRITLLTLSLSFLSPSMLLAADPFIGTWVMDTAKSQYPTGLPEKMTIVMEDTSQGVHYHSETQLRTGSSFTADYVAKYDGRLVIVSGAKGLLLPVLTKQIGSNEVIAQYMRRGQVVATSRRVVSSDGLSMTITTSSLDGTGNQVTNVAFYGKSRK